MLCQQERDHEPPGSGAHGENGDGRAKGEDVAAVWDGEDGGGRGEHDGAEDQVGVDDVCVEHEAETDPPHQVEDGADGEEEGNGGRVDVYLVSVCGKEEEEMGRPENHAGSSMPFLECKSIFD